VHLHFKVVNPSNRDEREADVGEVIEDEVLWISTQVESKVPQEENTQHVNYLVVEAAIVSGLHSLSNLPLPLFN